MPRRTSPRHKRAARRNIAKGRSVRAARRGGSY